MNVNEQIKSFLEGKKTIIKKFQTMLDQYSVRYDAYYEKVCKALEDSEDVTKNEENFINNGKKLLEELERGTHLLESSATKEELVIGILAQTTNNTSKKVEENQKSDELQADREENSNNATRFDAELGLDTILTPLEGCSFDDSDEEGTTTLVDAIIKKLVEYYPEPQPTRIIYAALDQRKIDDGSAIAYERVRSQLRYHADKTKLTKHDPNGWILNEDYYNKLVTMQDSKIMIRKFSEVKSIVDDTDDAENPVELELAERVLEESENKSITGYCQEILKKSGQSWLHVDQFLVILTRDYGLKDLKKINVAALLRSASKNNRKFRAYGKNRFGLPTNQKIKQPSPEGAP